MSYSDDVFSELKRTASSSKRSLEDSSDDDVPIQQLAKKRAMKPPTSSGKPPRPEADSDDDIPLTDLKKKTAAKAKTSPAGKARAPAGESKGSAKPASKAVKKSPPSDKKAAKGKAGSTPKGKTSKNSKKKSRSREQEHGGGDKLVTRSSVLQETKKGEMVQKLLCRWWYAMDWPAKKDVIPAPPSYVALEGYPGVYVCVEGDKIGKLLDVRNKQTCPCYANFSNKSSEELKQLLETALTKQKEELVAHWGQGLEEEAKIDRELKWLKTVDPGKADRAAMRALAHAKLDV